MAGCLIFRSQFLLRYSRLKVFGEPVILGMGGRMSGRSGTSFSKLQKERARREKQLEKRARRQQRKLDKQAPGPSLEDSEQQTGEPHPGDVPPGSSQ